MAVYTHCCRAQPLRQLGFLVKPGLDFVRIYYCSHYLCSFYIGDIIAELRKSGHSVCVGRVFVGCVVYADDIILMSSGCSGLQQMVNVCCQYGAW